METIDLIKGNFIEKGRHFVQLISSRGTMEILSIFCCSAKQYRFTEISRLLEYVGTKTLSARLKGLEREGILTRTAFNEIPPRVEYAITEKGQSLAEAAMPLIRWIMAMEGGAAAIVPVGPCCKS
ncbi:MAG TPA: helix-turn-helix domain-containing protein [Candidatus Lokiarchaeia archaeon]|nr:helix-turn-helix domain-containing protein [Candidatus Lokiarchaeia archaeon]